MDCDSVCRGMLGSTPATQRYKVRLCRLAIQESTVFCGEDLYSNSGHLLPDGRLLTTARQILILFAGGCPARRQLSNGVRYVSVTSKLWKSLSSVEKIIIAAVMG